MSRTDARYRFEEISPAVLLGMIPPKLELVPALGDRHSHIRRENTVENADYAALGGDFMVI